MRMEGHTQELGGVFVERLYNSRDRARDLHAVIYDAHNSAGRRHDI
jgi:hypothetical protein